MGTGWAEASWDIGGTGYPRLTLLCNGYECVVSFFGSGPGIGGVKPIAPCSFAPNVWVRPPSSGRNNADIPWEEGRFTAYTSMGDVLTELDYDHDREVNMDEFHVILSEWERAADAAETFADTLNEMLDAGELDDAMAQAGFVAG